MFSSSSSKTDKKRSRLNIEINREEDDEKSEYQKRPKAEETSESVIVHHFN